MLNFEFLAAEILIFLTISETGTACANFLEKYIIYLRVW